MADSRAARPDDIDHAAALVRADDRPRYYSTLFAPAAIRPDLLALYGFAAEIARVPDRVSEGGLGEIRLKWWQDALSEAAGGEGEGRSPVIRALAGALVRHSLPLAPLQALIEARAADLYSDPPPSLADLEGRLGETESALFQMAAIVAGGAASETADAAGHAGIAYGLGRRLGAFAAERAHGRTVFPAEFLIEEKLTPPELFAADPPPAFLKVVAAMMVVARAHLSLALTGASVLPRAVNHVFLPLAVVEPLLARIQAIGTEVALRTIALSDFAMLTRIATARLTGFRDAGN